MCHFVLVFFSPFSIAITSRGEERANLSAFRTFVRFVLVWICRFPLPLGVWEGLRFVIVALPGLSLTFFWAHYYEPENKAQSRQWVGPGSPRPKKFKTQPSAGKVIDTVFWDAKGVIMLDVLPKRSTITGVYYANLLDQLRTAIREKRRGKLSKGVLLQQDNARVHTCKVAMDAVERNGYELIPHPAYSPDLATSSYFQT